MPKGSRLLAVSDAGLSCQVVVGLIQIARAHCRADMDPQFGQLLFRLCARGRTEPVRGCRIIIWLTLALGAVGYGQFKACAAGQAIISRVKSHPCATAPIEAQNADACVLFVHLSVLCVARCSACSIHIDCQPLPTRRLDAAQFDQVLCMAMELLAELVRFMIFLRICGCAGCCTVVAAGGRAAMDATIIIVVVGLLRSVVA